jgi:predicted amidophosphoribosyltransferase
VAFFGLRGPLTLAGRNILLVDDIFTTGATCGEITKILFAGGVRSVTVAVLARAGSLPAPH